MEKIQQKFGFTAYLWHDIVQKYWIFRPCEDLIEQKLVLENYTDTSKVTEIIYTFQIEPSPVFFELNNRFAYKKGIIFLYAKIDYEIFKNATDQEALTLMCESYLEAILTIPSLRGMKKVPFDAQKLHEDLRNMFLEKGFLS